jgi:hypothetical protein
MKVPENIRKDPKSMFLCGLQAMFWSSVIYGKYIACHIENAFQMVVGPNLFTLPFIFHI